MLSIGGEGALREVPTPGKSGALFYKSTDDKFLIKTISKQEGHYFQDILAQYYNHIMMHHDTFLPRFFQLFRIKTNRGRSIRMVVMHNILPSNLNITERFDLKGSTFGRRTADELRQSESVTLKDLDFVEMGKRIIVGPSLKQRVFRQLSLDCTFLQTNKLMDYSLLVGISPLSPDLRALRRTQEAEYSRKMASFLAKSPPPSTTLFTFDGALEGKNHEGEPILIYCGIIDILQEYSMIKQMEHLFKGTKFDKHTISAVAPDQYSMRFTDYLKTRVFF
jgi:1-phosphatidylinositol-4-phosphate 5-kinase